MNIAFPDFITRKLYKNYLRVYANIGLIDYSTVNKQLIIDGFVNLSKRIFVSNKLKYDIDGIKIGLPKSSPLIGEKAFINRLQKSGYENIDAVRTILEGTNKASCIN